MQIKKVKDYVEPGGFIANKILEKLAQNKKVFWFATGGSSSRICIEVAKIISEHSHQGLTVSLTDERYGPVGHQDSNWQKLIEGGFVLPEARLMPVLLGENRSITTEQFNTKLEEALDSADYKIGLFGVGLDGHTAGILPESPAVESPDWAVDYGSEKFERITITPKTIARLDEAVVFTEGKEKLIILQSLEKDANIKDQPAQILKSVPLLTIFNKE